MDSVVSKIQETGQHTAKKTDAIFARTRDAGEAFLDEVRGAGKDLAVFVRFEAKGWRRFLTQQSSQLKTGARGLFTVPAIERQILEQVDGALRTIDAKVRARLAAIEKRGTKPARRKATPAPKATARKSKPRAATKSVSINGSGAPARH